MTQLVRNRTRSLKDTVRAHGRDYDQRGSCRTRTYRRLAPTALISYGIEGPRLFWRVPPRVPPRHPWSEIRVAHHRSPASTPGKYSQNAKIGCNCYQGPAASRYKKIGQNFDYHFVYLLESRCHVQDRPERALSGDSRIVVKKP